jgi:predicted Ser/Thr protein kinase
MPKCGQCAAENPDTSRFCGLCGASLTARSPASVIPTEAHTAAFVPSPRPASSGSDSSEDGRFVPGTLLGDRYRIISLLGAGGMGEVYRATDLKLGQAVALKFLPEEMARDPKALARFHTEVRIARQVAHPNVCRVYDLGEVEGYPYLSMEYVDGEDLHSLLRRIGRLPPDKAVEIARKLCAGLAAAHDRGVLHRDLKPSNIMIDGRGQVLITDFGLAGLMGQIDGAEARNGTPGYMSPEQLTGKEVTAKSDIYGLGVVLYEMFTGKRPFNASTRAELIRLTEEGMPPAPRSIVKDIDPAVESVILRCLAPDPDHRPTSAMAVLAALPGGDPLAAALAAGETPSPEMVAAAGEKAGMKPPVATAWLAGIFAMLALVTALEQNVSLFATIPFRHSPEVLAEKAAEMLPQFGYGDRAVSSAHGFNYREPVIHYLLHNGPGTMRDRFAQGVPATILFWYRSSPLPMAPYSMSELLRVSRSDPPENVPGMREVVLDPDGRLLGLLAVPPAIAESDSQPRPPAWNALFQAAGLDPARFRPDTPRWTPDVMADARAAWTGSYREAPDIPLRVEAAAFQGKPVFFATFGPWTPTPTLADNERSTGDVVYLILQLIVIFGSIPFARYNLRLGRGDMRGAVRVGLLTSAVGMATWLIGGTHVAAWREVDLFFLAAMRAAFIGITIAAVYISFEPFVRRRWPQTIISWSRFLAGDTHDPLVGRDILIGAAMGLALALIQMVGAKLYGVFGIPAVRTTIRESVLSGGRAMVGYGIFQIQDSLYKALGILFLIFLARTLLRRQWVAAGLITIALASIEAPNATYPYIAWPVNLAFFALMVFTLMRFGLVAEIVAIFTTMVCGAFALSTNFSVWPGEIAFTFFLLLAPALYGFRTALAGRPLFTDE